MHNYCVYLASKSPRRAELLQQIAVKYSVVNVDIDETPLRSELPLDYVRRMALEKARAGWLCCDQQMPVLGADTAGVFAGEILGKPKDKQSGLEMLRRLSGQCHTILSGVCLKFGQHELVSISESTVQFKPLSKTVLDAYWDSGEPADKAGAYGIQGLAAVFVEELRGSYSGVVGLPLAETYQLLEQMAELTGGME